VFWLSFFANHRGLVTKYRHFVFKQLVSNNPMVSDTTVQKSLEELFNKTHDAVEDMYLKRLEDTYEEWKNSPAGIEWLDKIRKARFFSFHLKLI